MTSPTDAQAQTSSPGGEETALHALLKELSDIKSALDAAAIVAITDAQGRIIYVNDTFCEISKYSRPELLGQDHRIVNSGHHPKAFFQAMWQTIGQGKVWKGEIKNRAKDGTFYWVDTTIVPFLDETTGKPYQYIAIRKDISYLKRVEAELRLLNEELEKRVHARTQELETANRELVAAIEQLQENERIRETFVSALTHDLRTPLVAARRALELFQMQRDALPPKLAQLSERLIQNNDDLLEMVNKLLETYQYEAGRIRLILEAVDLSRLAGHCLDHLAPLAEGKRIRLINAIPADLPPVEGDAHQLRRVLTNLVGNAIEHIGEGCTITVQALDQGETVELGVCDNGPGIPADIQPYLFDRYFAQQTRKKIGAGLGLSICKMIARMHGGAIRVESQVGQGACFYVTLPKRQANQKE